MKIVEIAPYKGKLCELVLDNGKKLWLHADLVQSEGLCAGDELDGARIAELRQRAAERRAYEYALYLLERRSYSYRGLYDKLMSAKNAQEDAVLLALERLVRIGLVNDEAYAESLARHYVEGKRFGLRRAAYEMRHKGLEQADIDAALEPYDDAEAIAEQLAELLEKKYARYLTDPDDRQAIERVTASLVRRGYAFRDIRFAIEDYFAELDAEED